MPAATSSEERTTSTGSILTRLKAIDTELGRLAEELVPERLPRREIPTIVRTLRRIEQRVSGARLILTDAAADTGAWRSEGFSSPEAWAAHHNGTSMGKAKSELKASKQLGNLPATRDAVGRGEISTDTAKGVAEGASADRDVERDLLDKARKGDLPGVRDGARAARRRADERNGKAAQRQYRRRSLRTWQDLDGEGHGAWNVPPSFQAMFEAALKPYRDQAFDAARSAGTRTPDEALLADAMMLLCRDSLADRRGGDAPPDPRAEQHAGARKSPADVDHRPSQTPRTPTPASPPAPAPTHHDHSEDRCHRGSEATLFGPTPSAPSSAGRPPRIDPADSAGGQPAEPEPADAVPGSSGPPPHRGGRRRAPAQIYVHVDHAALIRGYAKDGETCEIPGIGTVPVAYVRDLANDAVCHVVLTGTDVTVVSSLRRYIPVAIARALDQRDPTCVSPGCRRRHNLETHHWRRDFAKDGPTELDNLCRLCAYHHHLVTWCGWTLTGGPGRWRLLPPGADPSDDPP